MEMIINTPYYQDNSRVSNSSLGWFLQSPQYFRDKLDGKVEPESTKAMDKGTMIHMYLLQPDEFWKNYIILDFDTPTSAQQKEFAEIYVRTMEIDPNLKASVAFKQVYSTKGMSDEKVAEKALELVSKLENYIKYLEVGNDKTVISWSDLNMLKQVKMNVERHKLANELLLTSTDSPNVQRLSEFHINWEYPKTYHDQKILCKSLLDRVQIDHDLKTIKLIDIKTTSSISAFNDSMSKYDYYRQMCYYWIALTWYFKNVLNKDIEEYTEETLIVAIQTNGGYPVKVFRLSSPLITEKITLIDKIMQDIAYHTSNNSWEFSKDYYEGDGAEYLE